MKECPLISVVIPTHSGSKVISRAVESVLAQSYPNIEVIIVDDNGAGTNEQIATELELKKYSLCSKVKYITHKVSRNGSAARNTGARNSKGEYIALLDDDDYFFPDNLKEHYETLIAHDDSYGISFCGMHIVRDNIEEDIIAKQEGDVLIDFLKGEMRVGSSLVMIRRNVYEEVNGFDESFRRHQDWEFLVRIFTKYKLASTHKIGVVKVNLNRNSAKKPKLFEQNRIYYLDKMKDVISSLPLKTKQEIYDNHYTSIAREYFRAHQIGACLKWCQKTSHPFVSFVNIIHSAFVYFLR